MSSGNERRAAERAHKHVAATLAQAAARADASVSYLTAGLTRETVGAEAYGILTAMESVGASTYEQYVSHVNRLHDAGYEGTVRGLAEYVLENDPDHLSPSTIRRMHSAVRWHMVATRVSTGSDDEALYRMALQSYERRYVKTARPAGAVTPEQFANVLKYMEAATPAYDPELLTGMVFQYSFAFRADQVRGLLRRHFVETTDSIVYIGPAHKVKLPGSQVLTERHVLLEGMESVIRDELPTFEGDGDAVMFPTYSAAEVGKILRAAADQYKWSECLRWSAHSLRHGAISHTYFATLAKTGSAETATEAAMKLSAHQTKTMSEHYQRSQNQRIQEALANGDAAPLAEDLSNEVLAQPAQAAAVSAVATAAPGILRFMRTTRAASSASVVQVARKRVTARARAAAQKRATAARKPAARGARTKGAKRRTTALKTRAKTKTAKKKKKSSRGAVRKRTGSG